MTKAIITKASPKGHYIADDGDGNRMTITPPSGMQLEDKHKAAVRALCERMGWHGELIGAHVMRSGRVVARVWIWSDLALRIIITKE